MSTFGIDLNKKIQKPEIYLCKSDIYRTIIAKLNESYDIKLNVKLTEVNELSFNIPLHIIQKNNLIDNPNLSLLKEKRIIKLKLGNIINFFVIEKITDNSDDESDYKSIQCYSIEYKLKYNSLYRYNVESKTIEEVLTDVLKDTNWIIGYISPFLLVDLRRGFSVSNKNVLDFILNDMYDSYNGVPVFTSEYDNNTNTYINKVNFYRMSDDPLKNDIGIDKGLTFKRGKYLVDLKHENDFDTFCTRLKVFGKNGISINRYNPIGQNYIEDYSYFMYPFEIDKLGNIESHSDYMSDSLCQSLLNYNQLLTDNKDVYITYNKNLSAKQKQKSAKEILKNTLQAKNTSALDNIALLEEQEYKFHYKGTYNGNTITKKSENKEKNIECNYATIGKFSDTADLTIKVDGVTKIIEPNTWIVLGKVFEVLSTTIELSGSATDVEYDIYVVKIHDDEYAINGTAQGGTENTVVLDKFESLLDDHYIGYTITIDGETRNIIDYDGLTVTVTVDQNWSGAPTSSSVYKIENDIIILENYIPMYTQEQIDVLDLDIEALNGEISLIIADMNTLNDLLDKNNNFLQEDLEELNNFVFEKVITENNISDESQLYDYAISKFLEFNVPPISIDINIVNFLEIVEYQKEWNKLVIGDFVNVYHDKFKIDITTRIIEISYSFENSEISLTISNMSRKLSNENKFLRLLNKSLLFSKTIETKEFDWDKIAEDFNNGNNRISVTPVDPIVNNDGTAIEHTLNPDGSCNIVFKWEYPENTSDETNIDGFIIYVRSTSINDQYTFGATLAQEQYFSYPATKRSHILFSVSVTRYYTFGVQAYRKVDNDISTNGYLKSNIIKSTNPLEDPYQPEDHVAFGGDIDDTIDGIPIGNLFDNIAPTGGITVATSNINGSITISWSDWTDVISETVLGSGIAGYNIWRTKFTDFPILIKTINNKDIISYDDFSVANGESYFYQTTCYDQAGNESQLDINKWVSATSYDTVPPLPPVNLTIVGGVGRIDLRWDSPSNSKDIRYYLILVSDDNFLPESPYESYSVYSNVFTDFNRNTTNTRYYRIFSVDSVGNKLDGSFSTHYLDGSGNAVTVDIDNDPPTPPLHVSDLESDLNGSIIIKFNGSISKDASLYQIKRHICSDNEGTGGEVVGNVILLGVIQHIDTGLHIYKDGFLEKDIFYYYTINCIDTFGSVSETALRLPETGAIPAIDTTAPDLPGGFTAIGVVGGIKLEWIKLSIEDVTYEVWKVVGDTFGDGSTAERIAVVSGHLSNYGNGKINYIDNSPDPGIQTINTYKLKVIDKWNNSSEFEDCNPKTATSLIGSIGGTPIDELFDTTPPSGTVTISATPQTNGSIVIMWSVYVDNVGVVGYNIWRSVDGIERVLVGSKKTLEETSFTDNTTVNNTTYYYYVTAFDKAGNESIAPTPINTQWIQTVAKITKSPSAPNYLKAVGIKGAIKAFWNFPRDNIEQFEIQKSIDNGITWGDSMFWLNNFYEEYNVIENANIIKTQWKYRVRSIDILNHESLWKEQDTDIDITNYVPATGIIPEIPVIDNINTKSNYNGSITIVWSHNEAEDISEYVIYESTTGIDGNYLNKARVRYPTKSITISSLQRDVTYYYKVSALNTSGTESLLSDPNTTGLLATDGVGPNAPDNTEFLISQDQVGYIILTWQEISEYNETYEIWRKKPTDIDYLKIATVVGSTSNNIGTNTYVDYEPPIVEQTIWSYKIRAVDSWGNLGEFTNAKNGISLANSNIIWKGELASHPLNPEKNWTYRNTVDNYVYIYDGINWVLLVKDGVDGQDGVNGDSSYVWIRYSQFSNGFNMTTNPTDAKYIGIANTTTPSAPTSYTSYSWSLIKGTDGVAGEAGDTSYLHIKYSNDGVSFTSNNGEDVGSWIGTYTDFNLTDSNVFSDYTWNKIKGSTITIVIADENTTCSDNKSKADYIIPANSTNAQSTINTVINNLIVAGYDGIKISLLEGTYNISNSIVLKSNVELEICDGAVIKTYSGGNTCIVTNSEDCVTDIKIIGNGIINCNNLSSGISLISVDNAIIQNIKIINIKLQYERYGIYVNNCNNIKILKTILDGNDSSTYYLNRSGIYGAINNNFIISDNIISNFTQGIRVLNTLLYKDDVSITNNNIKTCVANGIYIYCTNSTIINSNIIYNCGLTTNDGNCGLYIYNCDNIIVGQNNITYCGNYGILLDNSNNVNVVNNIIQNSTKHGVYLIDVNNSIINNNNSSFNSTTNIYSVQIGLTSINSSSNDNFISGNICRKGTNTNVAMIGIIISGSNCCRNIVSSNDCYLAASTYAIVDSGTNTLSGGGNKILDGTWSTLFS